MRTLTTLLIAGALTGTATSTRGGTHSTDAEVDEYVRAQMGRTHTPGVLVAVVQDGRLVLLRGYGKASVELDAAATGDTVYELLSVGRQFTATAIVLLAHDGRVALDLPASTYLAGLPPAWSRITVRQLLAHTSGIPEYTTVISLEPRPE